MSSIHADKKLFPEIEKELNAFNIENRRGMQALNSHDGLCSEIILLATGSLTTLVAQAIVAWIKKGHGQRKVSVQVLKGEDMIHSVSVESPNLDEIEKLLKASVTGSIYLKENEANQSSEPT